MSLLIKRLVRTTLSLPVVIALILTLSLTAGTVLGSTFLGWPDAGTFQVAIDQEGHLRLLSPNIKGEHNNELKKNEFLIELPSRQLVATLGDNITQLVNRISELQSAIADLENRVTELESNPGGSGNSSNVVTQGLVHWLPMNEGRGSVLTDMSGLGNNGVITGATWTQLANGLWYLSFDGVDDFINSTNNAVLNPSAALTFEAWIYRTTTGDARGIAGRWDYNLDKRAYFLFSDLTDRLSFIISADGATRSSVISNGILASSVWYHVVGTYDGSVMRQYINGIADPNITTVSLTIYQSDAPTRIGVLHDFLYWTGTIGEVRIYNRALTPAEIENNYLASKGRYN